MSAVLYRIGHFAGRHPWRVLAAWVLVAVSAIWLNTSHGGESNENFRLPGAESQKAVDVIESRFPQQPVWTSNVIFHSKDGLTDPTTKAAVEDAVQGLSKGAHVIAVSDPYDRKAPTISRNGETAFATVGYDSEEIGADEFDVANNAVEVARDAGVQVEYDGALGYAKGDAEPSSEMIGIGVAVVVLLVAFGSLVAMSLPIIVALTAILIGTSAIGILSGQFAIPQIASVVGLMLGLGVGIDYALFILARHRQNLASGMTVPEAIGNANATAGLSVVFAGVTVVIAIAGMQLSGIPMLAVMGWASALMVLITMLAAITLLPALLGMVGRHVNSLRVPLVGRRSQRQQGNVSTRSASARWAARVVARPIPYGVVAGVLLIALATPAFSMRLGFADSGNDGPTTTTRRAYDLISEDYGAGVNGPLQVVVESDGSNSVNAAVWAVVRAVQDDPGVASVARTAVNDDSSLAVVDVIPTTGPQDEETSVLLTRLHGEVLPQALRGVGGDALVTGSVALQDDLSSRLAERMTWFLGAVIGLSFLLLLLVFRSVWIPVKAALLNLLSVGAAYGVVVAVFQKGWGASLIGVEETVPIMPLAPMLMFAILFGLSMDYEVFLLSRVHEQYLRHRDPRRAVVEGVGATGRVITSAALIMISVFGAFILSSDVTTKLFGVGLSVAVLLDVTLVRMVLVPAAMSLLGDRAWWLPSWLEHRLPHARLEEGATAEVTAGAAAEPSEEEGTRVLARG